MSVTRRASGRGHAAPTVDEAALVDALQEAATRCGRLTDEQVRSLRGRRRATVTGAAMACVAAALAIMGAPWLARAPSPHSAPAAWSRTVATRAGQRGNLRLADGSTIRLNGASRVRVVYTADRRDARLLAGQAFFDVQHDPGRPFIVHAGTARARVLGTAFDLDLTRRQVALAVYRGAVGFDPIDMPNGIVVRAGYRSSISGKVAAVPSRFDASLPDWREGWIDTAGMRLDDLVEVLDRQGTTRIAPPPGALASIKVFGRFRTDHPRQLLDAIGGGFGFVVVDRADSLSLQPAR